LISPKYLLIFSNFTAIVELFAMDHVVYGEIFFLVENKYLLFFIVS
jgi:hypothetical protein